MVRCEACGADAVDLDLDEPVCTECAALYRGGVVTLVNIEDYEGRYAQDATKVYVPLQALKSIRNDGWDMAGQGSLPTNERNMLSMNTLIQNLATALGHPGIAPRAQYLFKMAREHPDTNIRWGKAAEICAGAALFVALRAEGYSDQTNEIAASFCNNMRSADQRQGITGWYWRLFSWKRGRQGHAGASAKILERHLAVLVRSDRTAGGTIVDAVPLPSPIAHVDSARPHVLARLNVDPSEISRLLLRFLKQDASAVWNMRLAPSTADSFFDATLHFISSNAATFPAETRAFLHPLLPSGHHSVLKMARALYDNVVRPCARPDETERSPAVAAAALIMLALEGCARKPVPQVLKLAAALGARPGVGVLERAVMDRYRRALDDLETRARDVPFLALRAAKAGKQRGGVKADARRIQLARVAQDVVAFFTSDRARISAMAEAEIAVEAGADDTRSRKGAGKRTASPDPAASRGPRKKLKQTLHSAHGNARTYLLDPSISTSSPCLAASSYLLAPHAEPKRAQPTRLQQLSAVRGGEHHVDDTELFAEDELEGLILRDDDEEFVDRRRALDVLVPIDNREKAVAQAEKRLTPEERAKRRGLGRMNVDALRRVLGGDIGVLDCLGDAKLLRGDEENCGADEESAPMYAAMGVEEVIGEWRPPSP